MKTTYYYNSPIGILKLCCSESSLEGLSFVQYAEENPKQISKILSTCKEQLDRYFSGKLKSFDIPIEFTKGTEFQQNVWKALQNIPYGETRSYKDIATIIGNPKAVRAVGGANNKNPIGIIIPCHRVIGSSGKLVGYASGLDNKEWLLKHENKK
ncbi:methylated-DNA--[protein]-cysteine S-methyltransferase [Sulfurospirillum arcachonense]|uniref:methylated-DNA--[protein]-cysteine S-methyltransferase n=1 Tax=Sulfurospirillum arcachonense TaxID=57666 RepID=UPI0004699C7F|nr:methylated-DNA--[protein]-cysteine S-methyltransferase [Sulfurospirillum arcachonense]